jgi:endonuclease/exonuclease/phosphatase family metal-dependent hydrolase
MLRIMCTRRTILLGDFNAPPEAPELAPLWEKLTIAPAGPTFPADAPAKRIDHVAVSGGLRVRATSVPETPASDHRPVLAELSVLR